MPTIEGSSGLLEEVAMWHTKAQVQQKRSYAEKNIESFNTDTQQRVLKGVTDPDIINSRGQNGSTTL